jgi:4a-hydroxytetrahydrobiopterin dehydratase
VLNSDLPIKNWTGVKRRSLSATEIVAALARLEGWKLGGDGDSVAIEKTFRFNNYFETMAFANAVALVAHRQDHHPEMVVNFNRCLVRLNTHDVGGISATDFDCAAQIDALLA